MPGRACKTYMVKALSNLCRNRMMSFMATATIAFCLLLLGVSLVLGFNINYVSAQLEGQYEIHAYVDLSYSEDDARALKDKIESIDYVKNAEFVSKEQALDDMEESMADSASAFEMLHGDENPLPHTFDITLTDVRHADSVVKQAAKIDGIEEVKNRSDVLQKLVSTTRAAQLVAIVGMLIFAFVGIFIISNTIKMSVVSRSREIEIMKYVGATDWYIRWPFVIEGTVMGILGAVVAFVPVYFVYKDIVSWWMSTMPLFELLPVENLRNVTAAVFLVMGCLLGALGSMLSIRKHLRV